MIGYQRYVPGFDHTSSGGRRGKIHLIDESDDPATMGRFLCASHMRIGLEKFWPATPFEGDDACERCVQIYERKEK